MVADLNQGSFGEGRAGTVFIRALTLRSTSVSRIAKHWVSVLPLRPQLFFEATPKLKTLHAGSSAVGHPHCLSALETLVAFPRLVTLENVLRNKLTHERNQKML